MECGNFTVVKNKIEWLRLIDCRLTTKNHSSNFVYFLLPFSCSTSHHAKIQKPVKVQKKMLFSANPLPVSINCRNKMNFRFEKILLEFFYPFFAPILICRIYIWFDIKHTRWFQEFFLRLTQNFEFGFTVSLSSIDENWNCGESIRDKKE